MGQFKKTLQPFLSPNNNRNPIVTGFEYATAKMLAGLNIVWLSLLKYKNPVRALKIAARVFERSKTYKTGYPKIARGSGRYFLNLITPGWPSKAFNRYVTHMLSISSAQPTTSLCTLVFAITNKCSFQCEHCLEWEQLNRRDNLSADDIIEIIRRFHEIGISQVQLSGGEPLNRFKDILYILDSSPKGIDFWLYTNAYSLNVEKAAQLKQHGLTGVIISLDHHDPEKHDRFRGVSGSYERVLASAQYVIDKRLLLAFSCCATNDFISMNNLLSYARVCRDAGASFIQMMEPEAIGHYWKKEVTLNESNKRILENFYQLLNFDVGYSSYPVVSYPAMFKRNVECPGGGIHFLYVNADGYVQSCPFCNKSLFHAQDPGFGDNIRLVKEKGCALIVSGSTFKMPVGIPRHKSMVQPVKEPP